MCAHSGWGQREEARRHGPVLSRAGLMASALALRGGTAWRALGSLQAAVWRGDPNGT